MPPGEMLMEEVMRPFGGISINALAEDLAAPANRIRASSGAPSAITAGGAVRLAKHFGASPEIWLDLRSECELRVAR